MDLHVEPLLTTAEAAQLIGCSSQQVRRYLERGFLPSQRAGGTGWNRIPLEAVEEFCARKAAGKSSLPGPDREVKPRRRRRPCTMRDPFGILED